MAQKNLDNVQMLPSWTSYMASVGGCLVKAGMFSGDIVDLMGQTGMAFHFIVRNDVCPSGPTVYDWHQEHFMMMDRIGIHSSQLAVFNNGKLNTFGLIREQAIQMVRRSIDRGVPVVTWAPTPILEFGILTGYDDEQKAFSVSTCVDENPDPLLYDNLGISEAPWLYMHVFLEKVDVPEERKMRQALEWGVKEWNSPAEFFPGYARGKMAYQYLANALEKRAFNPFGLTYNLAVYADAKKHLAQFVERIVGKYPNMESVREALEPLQEVAAFFETMAKRIPFQGPNPNVRVEPEKVVPTLEDVQRAAELEDKAMSILQASL